MILYVTSFNKKLYEATGKDMLESFVYVKTEGEILVTYEDDITIPKHRKFIPYNLETDDFLNNWLEENKDVIPKSIGGNFEGSMSKYNARASKWFRKIAALNKALEYKDRYEAIVFVDSDTTFKNKITEEYVLSVFDDSAMFYHLGQYRKHIDAGIESGFIGFHMKNGGDKFLRRTIEKFQDKSYREYTRWDDGYVFKKVVEETKDLLLKDVVVLPDEELNHELGFGTRGSGHVIPKGPFADYLQHRKGVHWQKYGVRFEDET